MSGDLRVLVVDDDAGARALHCRFVADTPGFAVAASTGTGLGALEWCRQGVDLVLLDMRLPDISGVEVLHRLRTLGVESPDVLVISSSRDQVTVRQALAAHVIGYLIKPFTEEVLQQRLQAYATRRREREQGGRERTLAQGEIDRLLATGRTHPPSPSDDPPRERGRSAATGSSPADLPKGLAAVTLNRIVSALDPVELASTAQVAMDAGVSRATARRYLDHLVATGVIDLAHRYGKRGRPEVLYRLAPSPER